MSFGQMPFGWITNGMLHEFSGAYGRAGLDVAALKTYLAIAAYRDFRSGETVLSTQDFETLTGASRSTVLKSTKLLEGRGLVTIEGRAERNTNVYMLGSVEAGFRKVPQDTIVKNLRTLSNRPGPSLAALRIYLALLYYRDGDDNCAKVSHAKLVKMTGVRPTGVKKAVKLLMETHLVGSVFPANDLKEIFQTALATNSYLLTGDFAGKRQPIQRPTDLRNQQRRQLIRSSRPVTHEEQWLPDDDVPE